MQMSQNVNGHVTIIQSCVYKSVEWHALNALQSVKIKAR